MPSGSKCLKSHFTQTICHFIALPKVLLAHLANKLNKKKKRKNIEVFFSLERQTRELCYYRSRGIEVFNQWKGISIFVVFQHIVGHCNCDVWVLSQYQGSTMKLKKEKKPLLVRLLLSFCHKYYHPLILSLDIAKAMHWNQIVSYVNRYFQRVQK